MKKAKIQLGQRIRVLRKARGLTQEQLAELVDIEQKHVSCIELGKNSPPIDRLEKIAQALDVPIKTFFELESQTEVMHASAEITLLLQELDADKRQLACTIFKGIVQALQQH